MSGTPQVRGYRNLSEIEIVRINRLKDLEQHLVDELKAICRDLPEGGPRHLAMARSYLEIGFIFAIKSIAQPTGGFGDSRARDGVGTGGG